MKKLAAIIVLSLLPSFAIAGETSVKVGFELPRRIVVRITKMLDEKIEQIAVESISQEQSVMETRAKNVFGEGYSKASPGKAEGLRKD
ncbi:MAG: hypothetical protein D6806_03695 [Deltaproteobacteria bacterium]|nr:MAG: hypothetical protein D6806_03695 [Deltaproteobacteria bacterium]